MPPAKRHSWSAHPPTEIIPEFLPPPTLVGWSSIGYRTREGAFDTGLRKMWEKQSRLFKKYILSVFFHYRKCDKIKLLKKFLLNKQNMKYELLYESFRVKRLSII